MNASNPEIDTTKFINVDDKKFSIYLGGKLVFELEPLEEKVMVVYAAQVGAKHLVDRILQEKHGIRDTLKDSDLRRSYFAKILPEMASERNIKPLTPDQEKTEVKEMLARQKDIEKSLRAKDEERESKDKERDALLAKALERIAELENKPVAKKAGRPPKVVAPESTQQ